MSYDKFLWKKEDVVIVKKEPDESRAFINNS